MKCNYIAPKIKTIAVHLPVMMEGSITPPNTTTVNDVPAGDGTTDPENSGNGSRYLRQSMWDDMN